MVEIAEQGNLRSRRAGTSEIVPSALRRYAVLPPLFADPREPSIVGEVSEV